MKNGGHLCHWETYFFGECGLGGIYVPCITCKPGGVIVGDVGLCCCVSRYTRDINQSNATSINSLGLFMLQKRSGPRSLSDCL